MSDNKVQFVSEATTTPHAWYNVRGYGTILENSYAQKVPLALQKDPKSECVEYAYNRIPSLKKDNFTMVDRNMAWSKPDNSPWWSTDFYGWTPCDLKGSSDNSL